MTITDVSNLKKVLPHYFNSDNVISFQRQLNMYGFVKPNKEDQPLTFKRDFFDLDKPENFWKITRKTLKKRKVNEDSKEAFIDNELLLLKKKAQAKQMIRDAELVEKNMQANCEEINKQSQQVATIYKERIRRLIMVLCIMVNKQDAKATQSIKKVLEYLKGIFSQEELDSMLGRGETSDGVKVDWSRILEQKAIINNNSFWSALEELERDIEQNREIEKIPQEPQDQSGCEERSCVGSNLGDLWEDFNKNVDPDNSSTFDLSFNKEN